MGAFGPRSSVRKAMRYYLISYGIAYVSECKVNGYFVEKSLIAVNVLTAFAPQSRALGRDRRKAFQHRLGQIGYGNNQFQLI